MNIVIISQMRANQGYEQMCVFSHESIKLSHEGSDIFNVSVLNVFLCQKFFDPSIVFLISGMKEPKKDAKLNKLNAYANADSYLS